MPSPISLQLWKWGDLRNEDTYCQDPGPKQHYSKSQDGKTPKSIKCRGEQACPMKRQTKDRLGLEGHIQLLLDILFLFYFYEVLSKHKGLALLAQGPCSVGSPFHPIANMTKVKSNQFKCG